MDGRNITQKVWGSEELIANEEGYCGKRMVLDRGYRCSIHYHPKKHETFRVERGVMLVEIEEEPFPGRAENELRPMRKVVMRRGDKIVVPPNTAHRFTGLEQTVFYEFSTHDDPSDSIRITPSEKVPEITFIGILAENIPR